MVSEKYHSDTSSHPDLPPQIAGNGALTGVFTGLHSFAEDVQGQGDVSHLTTHGLSPFTLCPASESADEGWTEGVGSG